jgi:hypothetical protein
LEPFSRLIVFKIMNRAEMLQRLRDEPVIWDVLVIGGGARWFWTHRPPWKLRRKSRTLWRWNSDAMKIGKNSRFRIFGNSR